MKDNYDNKLLSCITIFSIVLYIIALIWKIFIGYLPFEKDNIYYNELTISKTIEYTSKSTGLPEYYIEASSSDNDNYIIKVNKEQFNSYKLNDIIIGKFRPNKDLISIILSGNEIKVLSSR